VARSAGERMYDVAVERRCVSGRWLTRRRGSARDGAHHWGSLRWSVRSTGSRERTAIVRSTASSVAPARGPLTGARVRPRPRTAPSRRSSVVLDVRLARGHEGDSW
jgi:hypothetical protein